MYEQGFATTVEGPVADKTGKSKLEARKELSYTYAGKSVRFRGIPSPLQAPKADLLKPQILSFVKVN